MKPMLVSLLTVGAFVLGYLVAPRAKDDSRPRAAGSGEVARLQARVTQLERQLAKTKREEADAHPAVSQIQSAAARRADDLQILVRLARDKTANFQVPVLTQAGMVSKPLIERFYLSPTEVDAFQGIVTSTRNRLAQHAAATAQVAQADASGVAIAVPPFEQAGEMYDSFMNRMADILGPDRYAVFLALEGDEVSRAFGGFGADQRNISVRLNRRPDGSSSLVVMDNRVGPNGATSWSGVNVTRGDPFPDNLMWLTRFEPDFANLQPAFDAGKPIGEAFKATKISKD